MKKYLVTIDTPSNEAPYFLTIFPSGQTGSLVRHKQFDDATLRIALERDMAASEGGVKTVLEILSANGSWTSEIALSDEAAANLGWIH